MNKEWDKDTGATIALISLFLGVSLEKYILLIVAGILLILVLFTPSLLRPLGYLWFKISILLAKFIPKILLGLVFIVVVYPIGKIRNLLGYDSLMLNINKYSSSFKKRDAFYTKEDLIKPF